MNRSVSGKPLAHVLPAHLVRRKRRLVVALVASMLVALGPVWGVFYTLCIVLQGLLTAGSDVTLTAVRQVTISLTPTLIGIAVAPVGMWIAARLVLRLADLRKEVWQIESQR